MSTPTEATRGWEIFTGKHGIEWQRGHEQALAKVNENSVLLDINIHTDLSPKAGAGVFSEILSFYVPVGRGTAFDSEITAIRTAQSQLQCHLEKFTRAVILWDSRAALLTIVSNNNPKTQDILDCRYHLEAWHT
ncbi:hypothetical protein CEXT_496791 [Caerostris extrusa]|uniref:RNase H type-1 domain-containing protein n=1 Tax=Caerostris extrusa TaxID=172846 RepID=A0AAV4NJH8_CAEEX|nr:hypothetical protein CEXT_496791 [Caerostris extrusa]